MPVAAITMLKTTLTTSKMARLVAKNSKILFIFRTPRELDLLSYVGLFRQISILFVEINSQIFSRPRWYVRYICQLLSAEQLAQRG